MQQTTLSAAVSAIAPPQQWGIVITPNSEANSAMAIDWLMPPHKVASG